MSEHEAWVQIAKWCCELHIDMLGPPAEAWLDTPEVETMRCTFGPYTSRSHGLCHAIDRLGEQVGLEVWRKMRQAVREEFRRTLNDGIYLWPVTAAGHAKRRQFCLRQAVRIAWREGKLGEGAQ